MIHLTDCIVLQGPDLQPYRCHNFTVEQDAITRIDLGNPCNQLEQGALVIIPGLYNSHTHMGDSCLPDGTTGMTLEEGFFRPHGYKYQELSKQPEAKHLEHIVAHLSYMARTGTVGHIDFREQGVYGSQLLRQAAEKTGINSVILGQFNQLPFTERQLKENHDDLSESAIAELDALLAIADGFSESTMNDLTDPAWQQICARTQHKLRAIHCLENEDYRKTSLAITGRGDLERALELYRPHLVIHATVANVAEIELLSTHCVNVVLNPRANANLGLPSPPIASLLQSQANLLLGTDNGLLNSPNMFAELDFTYKVAKSQFGNALQPDPVDILKMATSNICGVLGQDIYGYLDVGLPADFAVLNFTQPHLRATRHILASIVTRTTPDDVLATVCQGQILYQEPNFTLAV